MRVSQYFILWSIFISLCCCLSASSINKVADAAQWNALKKQIETYRQKNTDSLLYFLKMADSFDNQYNLGNKAQLFLENAIGGYCSETARHDSAIHAFNNALETAILMKNDQMIHYQMTKLAGAYNNIYLADSALKYYRKALPYFREQNDTLITASILSGIVTALIEAGLNKEALERLYEAEQIFKTTTKFGELGVIYDNIAMINARLGDEKNTIKYGKKAISLYQKAHDTLMLADAYANLGVSYKNLNQYDTALYYYEKSNALARQINGKWLLAKNLHSIGIVHDVTGSPEKAAESFAASLKVCTQEKFLFGEFTNSVNLGDYEMNYGDVQQAIRYFERAAELGKQLHFANLGLVYDKLYLAHDKAGSNEEALSFLRKYMHFHDSAFAAQKHQEIMELQTRYGTHKKQAQLIELAKQQQKDELLRAYLLPGIGGLLLTGLLVFIWSWRRYVLARQKALQLENENQKKHDEMEKLRLEKKLEQEEAEHYRIDLCVKEQELVYQTLKQAGLAHLNKKVKDELSPFTHRLTRKKDQELFSKKIQEITRESKKDPLSDFEEMFTQMHDQFYEKLLEISGDLTQNDLQMAALLRMNLPSKEIADLLNLAVDTIDHRRHTIRKKLNLSSDQNLVSFLISI